MSLLLLPLHLCALTNVDTSSSQGEIYLQVLFSLNFNVCILKSHVYSPQLLI